MAQTAQGAAPLGNGENGVSLLDGVQYNQIGVSNTIAFNGLAGVEIQGPNTLHNRDYATPFLITAYKASSGSRTFGGANAQVEITDYDLVNNRVTGTACSGCCLVEIYAHDSITPAGRIFLVAGWSMDSINFLLH
ncbi:MAG: hypothetical protein R2911_21700 [Caldilineaceae bacterium]